jgi:hypothetical protein
MEVAGAFGDNANLFRKFLVDFETHAVALEAFEHDPVNAPLVAHRVAGAREAFAKTIEALIEGGSRPPSRRCSSWRQRSSPRSTAARAAGNMPP